MPPTDREELKEQLRAMVAGRGDGIDLDTPFHWVIEGLKQPGAFFEHLPTLLPLDSILYVEGTSIAPEVEAFYSSHRAPNAVDVVRDTIAPVPDIYHCTFSPEVCAALRQFAVRHPVAEMFDHIKAYWIMLGEKVSQAALLFGADDLDGTWAQGIYAAGEAIRHSGLAAYRDSHDPALVARFNDRSGVLVGSGGGVSEPLHRLFCSDVNKVAGLFSTTLILARSEIPSRLGVNSLGNTVNMVICGAVFSPPSIVN